MERSKSSKSETASVRRVQRPQSLNRIRVERSESSNRARVERSQTSNRLRTERSKSSNRVRTERSESLNRFRTERSESSDRLVPSCSNRFRAERSASLSCSARSVPRAQKAYVRSFPNVRNAFRTERPDSSKRTPYRSPARQPETPSVQTVPMARMKLLKAIGFLRASGASVRSWSGRVQGAPQGLSVQPHKCFVFSSFG